MYMVNNKIELLEMFSGLTPEHQEYLLNCVRLAAAAEHSAVQFFIQTKQSGGDHADLQTLEG
jgi:hypothetical protein